MMRRTALAFTVAVALLLPTATTATAIGPGGWDHAGHGTTATMPSLNGAVYALNADDPGVLLVGGNFTSAGGNANARRIATWNGVAWGSLNGPTIDNGAVRAIAYHLGDVYAGGTFLNAGGNADADFLAVWRGTGWEPFCTSTKPGPAFGGSVLALQVIGNTLFVGGSFANGAGIDAADFLLACDLTTGASSATVPADGDLNGGVNALTADSNGVLYAGGQFINLAGHLAADHVASYDGSWHAMGAGGGPDGGAVDSIVRSLAAHGTDVYVGTDSLNVAGIARADHVVRWNGSSWSAVGSNTAGTNGWFPTSAFINTLSTFGAFVIAAGSFQNANGVATADHIAYFDGTSWRPIGSNGAGNGPMIGNMVALATFRSKVYVAGSFTSAGGDVLAQSLAAYALLLPDARIGLVSSGPFVGNSVYNASAVGEARAVTLARRHTATFYVSIQNDGLVTAAFKVQSFGSATGYAVRYFRGATNVTAAVVAGTYSTGAIGPRGAITLRMQVIRGTVTAAAAVYLVRVTSVAGTPADAVKAIVRSI